MESMEYAGFWIRVGAALIDAVLLLLIISPILTLIYGNGYWLNTSLVVGFWDFVLNYLFPAVAVILFWVYKSATPGKMALKLKILDANTGDSITVGQAIGRYLGYIVAMLPLMIGIIWVGIDKRKQGLHDKLAGTVVVRNTEKEQVQFSA